MDVEYVGVILDSLYHNRLVFKTRCTKLRKLLFTGDVVNHRKTKANNLALLSNCNDNINSCR